jgi:hypothetical protein
VVATHHVGPFSFLQRTFEIAENKIFCYHLIDFIAPPFFSRGARERGGQARKFLPHTPSFPRLPAELTILLEMGSRYIQYFPPDCKRPPFEVVFL